MAKQYYTLAVRDADGNWSPEFGDYTRADVAAELDDYLDHGHKRKDLKIIVSGDKQADIVAAIATLNANWRKA